MTLSVERASPTTFLIRRHFAAPPARLYLAHTDPHLVHRNRLHRALNARLTARYQRLDVRLAAFNRKGHFVQTPDPRPDR